MTIIRELRAISFFILIPARRACVACESGQSARIDHVLPSIGVCSVRKIRRRERTRQRNRPSSKPQRIRKSMMEINSPTTPLASRRSDEIADPFSLRLREDSSFSTLAGYPLRHDRTIALLCARILSRLLESRYFR